MSDASAPIPLLPDEAAIGNLTDAEVHALCMGLRWPDGQPHCPKCGGTNLYDISRSGRGQKWMCKAHPVAFSLTSGTRFAYRNVPLRTVLLALSLAQHESASMSLREMTQRLRTNYKTGYVLIRRAQEVLAKGLLGVSEWKNYSNDSGRCTREKRVTLTYAELVAKRHSDSIAKRSVEDLLIKPFYPDGRYYNTGSWWLLQERVDLRRLVVGGATVDQAAAALGRSPSSVASRAGDFLSWRDLPQEWRALARPRRLTIPAAPRLFVYPYLPSIPKMDAGNGARLMLDVSGLVAKAFPDFMRADIAQTIILAILEGSVTLDQLRGQPDAVRQFVRNYRKGFDMQDGSRMASLDQAMYGEDDGPSPFERILPQDVLNRLEW